MESSLTKPARRTVLVAVMSLVAALSSFGLRAEAIPAPARPAPASSSDDQAEIKVSSIRIYRAPDGAITVVRP